jgi:hypothetical protein
MVRASVAKCPVAQIRTVDRKAVRSLQFVPFRKVLTNLPVLSAQNLSSPHFYVADPDDALVGVQRTRSHLHSHFWLVFYCREDDHEDVWGLPKGPWSLACLLSLHATSTPRGRTHGFGGQDRCKRELKGMLDTKRWGFRVLAQ